MKTTFRHIFKNRCNFYPKGNVKGKKTVNKAGGRG